MKGKFILAGAFALFTGLAATAQTNVTTGTTKYPLLEEGTGTWCGYCPDGAQRLQQTVEPNYPNAITVAFHNADPMELTGDPFNTAFITGFPGATIDRKVWTHGSTTSQNVNRGYWATDVGVQSGDTAKFQITMQNYYDSSTRTVSLKVSAKSLYALSGNYRINVYRIEDSISSASSSYVQHSYMYSSSTSWFYNQCQSACPGYPCSSCANLPDSIYSHMHVVTKVLAAGGSIWGDTAFTNPAANVTKTKYYTDILPTSSPSKYVSYVALVQKYGSATTDRQIMNAAKAKVRLMSKRPVSTPELEAGVQNVEIYPNPASNYIHVSANLATPSGTKLVLTNSVGQVVAERDYPQTGSMFAENIQVDNLPAGIYLLTLHNNGESVTNKVSIVK